MAGGDSGKSVARMNEIGGECDCSKHFLQAFRLTARVLMTSALGLRAGPPGITPFRFSATECPARVSVWGYRREIRAGQECRLPQDPESDRPRGPLTLSVKGRHIVDPARTPADPRVSVSVTVRYLTFSGMASVHFLRLLRY